MRWIADSVESYALDHVRCPDAKNMDELASQLEPTYSGLLNGKRVPLPRKDPWGTPYQYIAPSDGEHFWILSYGADGKADADIYDSEGLPQENAVAKTSVMNDDIIHGKGGFIRSFEQPDQLALLEMKKSMSVVASDICSVLSASDMLRVFGSAGSPTPSPGDGQEVLGSCRYEFSNMSFRIQIFEPDYPEDRFDLEVSSMQSAYPNQEMIDGLGDKASFFSGQGFVVLKGPRLLIVRYSRVDPEKLREVLPNIVGKL